MSRIGIGMLRVRKGPASVGQGHDQYFQAPASGQAQMSIRRKVEGYLSQVAAVQQESNISVVYLWCVDRYRREIFSLAGLSHHNGQLIQDPTDMCANVSTFTIPKIASATVTA